jgi:hypothetical protein
MLGSSDRDMWDAAEAGNLDEVRSLVQLGVGVNATTVSVSGCIGSTHIF